MDFKVINPSGGGEDFTGPCTFRVLDSGALEIRTGSGNPRKRIVYSPVGWSVVEVTKEDEPGQAFRGPLSWGVVTRSC